MDIVSTVPSVTAVPDWQQATDGAVLRSRLLNRTYAMEGDGGTGEWPDWDGSNGCFRGDEGIEMSGQRCWDRGDGGQLGQRVGFIACPEHGLVGPGRGDDSRPDGPDWRVRMARILVAGSESGAGATTVAVGLASVVANAGQSVRVERLAGDDRASDDAEVFGELEVGAGSGDPLTVEQVTAKQVNGGGGVLILEGPAGADAGALASQLGARLVFVRPAGSDAPLPDGAPSGATVIETHAAHATAGAVPEDRALAAPRVAELIAASGAEVLTRSEAGERAVCDHLVVGAISHDPADDYFGRFERKAVVTRNGRVDLALAAMLTGTECLILSGGGAPSPYVLDRAAAGRETTLLLTSGTTVETMHDIEGCFGTSPFSGESKVARAGELLAAALDAETVSALIA